MLLASLAMRILHMPREKDAEFCLMLMHFTLGSSFTNITTASNKSALLAKDRVLRGVWHSCNVSGALAMALASFSLGCRGMQFFSIFDRDFGCEMQCLLLL